MKELQKEVLRHESTRRFLVEVSVVAVLIVVVMMAVVEPYLLGRFPSVFPDSPVRSGSPQAWIPETRLGWFTAVFGALLLGTYMYYRIAFTELGEQMISLLEVEQ